MQNSFAKYHRKKIKQYRLKYNSMYNIIDTFYILSTYLSSLQVLVRLQPSISADVHPYLNTGSSSKFGIAEEDLAAVLEVLRSNSKIVIMGLHVHIGSMVQDVSVYTDIHQYARRTIARHRASLPQVRMINIGGGLAVDYTHQGHAPSVQHLQQAVAGE